MNLLANTKWLCIFLACILFSCKEKYNIKIAKPQDNVGAFFHDTLAIESTVIWDDTLNTSMSPNNILMVGQYSDPYLGTLEAQSFARLYLAPEKSLVKNPNYRSAVLYFQPFQMRGDTTVKESQTFNVYRLTSPLQKGVYHASSEKIAYDPTPVGTVDFTASVKKQFAVQLSEDFGKKLLSHIGKSNIEFQDAFPGIALVSKGGVNSRIISLGISDQDTGNYIRVNFDTGGVVLNQKFLIGGDSTKYYTFSPNWSSEYLNGLQANKTISTGATKNLGFVQAGTRLRTKLTFPGIQNLGKGRSVVVNKAELVINVANLADSLSMPLLSLYKVDARNYLDPKSILTAGITNDANRTPYYFYFYNSSKKSYTFDITYFIQGLIYETDPNIGLMITPYITSDLYTTNAAVFYDAMDKMNTKRMKVNIYYTLVD